jgi:DNA adenine methylase
MLNNVIMLSILVDCITMLEKDEDVAVVWQAILNGGAKWLADEIAHFQLSPESARAAITRAAESLERLAFVTIIKFGSRYWIG